MARHSHARPIEPSPALSVTDNTRSAASAALELDRVIHERMRLAIVSALAVSPTLSFNELKRSLDMTDGNLSVHARKLEEAGYLRCLKSFEGRTPRTDFELTDRGRQALERYLAHMEALIRATKGRREK